MNEINPKVTDPVEVWRNFGQQGADLAMPEPCRTPAPPDEPGRRAEALIAGEPIDFQARSPQQVALLIDRLRAGQVELKTQNEELRHAQEELAAAREQYADLYDYAPIAYITTDGDGTIIAANLTAADLLGVGRNEMIGAPLSDFVVRQDQDTLVAHRREVRRYGCLRNCELTMIKANGETYPAQLDSVVAPDRDGQFEHCRTVISDVTERVRADQALAQVRHRESLEILAAGIAHDFNNLLTGVMGAHSLATVELKTSPEHLPMRLSVMGKGLEVIRDLVHQLLTLGSPTPTDKRVIATRELVEQGCRMAVTAGNVECDCDLPARLWPVIANEQTVSRAIRSLVTNAVEAMPNGGLIQITADNAVVLPEQVPGLHAGHYVRISVADAGPGIPEDYLPRIFDPYFSTKERGPRHGMGLSLAMCHATVAEHGGVITAESRIGIGTTLHVYLPASAGTVDVRRDNKPCDAAPLMGVGRILVLDDQEIVRTAACDMLTQLGYAPVAARDGAEAVGMYREAVECEERFAAVIVDLTSRGGIGGSETMKDLLEIDPTVVALISSGFVNDPALTDFAQYGFRGVLPKPYGLAELGQALHAALHDAQA